MSSSPSLTVGNPFRALWSKGYRFLVPIIPHDAALSPRTHIRPQSRGKAPGVLWDGDNGWWGGIKDWQTREPSDTDIDAWAAMGAGCGLRLGLQADGTYLHAIDADTLHGPSADTVRAIVERIFGVVPIRIGRAPKALYLIRTSDPLPYRVLTFLEGAIEFLGQFKQCVMHGIHPFTKQPYAITKVLLPLATLTIHTAADLERCFHELRAALPEAAEIVGGGDRANVNQNALVGDPDAVAAAVAAIPNTYTPGGPHGYAYWIKVAAALRGALPEDYGLALELFEEFTERGNVGPEPAESAPRVFGSFKAPFGVGASWLYEEAVKRGGGKFDPAEPWFDAAAAASASDFMGGGPEDKNRFLGGQDSKRSKFAFEALDDVAASALAFSTRPLIKGLLDQGAMTVLYGESNTGKTFVAMDIAYHIARGDPWGGMRTIPHRAVYVAAEGGVGARKRAAALFARYGSCPDFLYLLAPVNLLRPDADLVPLIEALRALDGVGFVVLDTLSRVMAGGDENSSTDMGALVRHVDAVRAATGAHVLVVHHTGKDTAKGARGHSLLRAATDTEIEVSEGRVAVTKQRDLDREYVTGFDLVPVTLGVDPDGEAVSSCTVSLRAVASTSVAPGSADASRQAEALDVLRGHAWRIDKQSPEWAGMPIAGVLDMPTSTAADKRALETLIQRWIDDGLLVKEKRGDKLRRPRLYVTVKASVFD